MHIFKQYHDIRDIFPPKVYGKKSIYATTDAFEYPFGNRQWTLVGEDEDCLAQENTNASMLVLSLNACTQDEFNCADGQCVDISQRCDRRIDCDDKSGSYLINSM